MFAKTTMKRVPPFLMCRLFLLVWSGDVLLRYPSLSWSSRTKKDFSKVILGHPIQESLPASKFIDRNSEDGFTKIILIQRISPTCPFGRHILTPKVLSLAQVLWEFRGDWGEAAPMGVKKDKGTENGRWGPARGTALGRSLGVAAGDEAGGGPGPPPCAPCPGLGVLF